MPKPATFPLLLLLVGAGCTQAVSERELVGTYVVPGLTHNADTLHLFADGTYARVLYRRAGRQRLFANANRWGYANNTVILRDFLLDEDDRYGAQKVYGAGSLDCILPLDKRSGKPVIYFQMEGATDLYYEKL